MPPINLSAHSGAFNTANQFVAPQGAFHAANQPVAHSGAFGAANQPVAHSGAFGAANQFVVPQGAFFGAANQFVASQGAFDTANQLVAPQGAFHAANHLITYPDDKAFHQHKKIRLTAREEKIPDLMRIELRLNSSQEDLALELIRLRDRQLEYIIKQLASGESAKKLRLPYRKEMHNKAMQTYRLQIREGRNQLTEELARQKKGTSTTKLIDYPPEDYDEYLTIMAEELAIKVDGAGSKLIAIMSQAALELRRRGITGDELRQRLRGKAAAKISDRTWRDIAACAVNKGWGAGREIEIRNQADSIEYCYYSSVLDRATCQVCLKLDGNEHPPGDPAYMTPNPDCLGGDKCRCMTVAVYSRELLETEDDR